MFNMSLTGNMHACCSTNLTEIGEGRRKVVSINLDRMADSVSGQTVVDPKGYLTDLNSITLTSDAEIGDIKKARTLLKSVINTNPKHAPGWVAAARLEELAGCALPFLLPDLLACSKPLSTRDDGSWHHHMSCKMNCSGTENTLPSQVFGPPLSSTI